MSRNATHSPIWKGLFQLMIVLGISVALLVATGALRPEGPYDTTGKLLAFYFAPYFVAVQFFGGVHGVDGWGQSAAFTIAVITQNVFLWYVIWFRPRYLDRSRDI